MSLDIPTPLICSLLLLFPISLSLSLSLSFSFWIAHRCLGEKSFDAPAVSVVVISEPDWISRHVCVYMSCSLRFDEIFFATSFCGPILPPLSLSRSACLSVCLPLYLSAWLSFSPFSSVENVVARSSRLFVLLSLVWSRAVIIVIREICKFDDRLGSACSMQTYYRLSVCMARGRASVRVLTRLVLSRAEATVDRGIHNRDVFCVYMRLCVYSLAAVVDFVAVFLVSSLARSFV